MATSSVPRIGVIGIRSGAGKSFLVTGLILALRRRGISVACCVTGTAMHQATVYSRLIRRPVRSLDGALLSAKQLKDAVGQSGLGADMVLIDGQGGLYDTSASVDLDGSDASLARVTGTPCILVVDFHAITRSLAPIVGGFAHFPDAPQVEGVVINGLEKTNLAEQVNREKAVRDCDLILSAYDLPACLGCIPAAALTGSLPDRSMVQDENGAALPFQIFSEIERLVEQSIDVDQVVAVARLAEPLDYEENVAVVSRGACRIAVASDSCFHVCYQDNIELLREFGAEIVNFSPLADASLPQGIGGIYLAGGCLGEYGESVESNRALMESIRMFVSQGGVLYSEGAGSALLCRSFKPLRSDRMLRGAGVLPFDAIEGPQHPEYARFRVLEHSVFGEFGVEVGGIVTSEWKIKDRLISATGESAVVDTLRYDLPGVGAVSDGFSVSAESCCSFNFLHFGSNPDLARALVVAASTYQRARKPR